MISKCRILKVVGGSEPVEVVIILTSWDEHYEKILMRLQFVLLAGMWYYGGCCVLWGPQPLQVCYAFGQQTTYIDESHSQKSDLDAKYRDINIQKNFYITTYYPQIIYLQ